MSRFLQSLQYVFSILPTWVWVVFCAALVFVLIVIVLKIIKLILDAVPFV